MILERDPRAQVPAGQLDVRRELLPVEPAVHIHVDEPVASKDVERRHRGEHHHRIDIEEQALDIRGASFYKRAIRRF